MHPPEPSVRRVAFFGGSFDPPHRGHVAVARAARAALGLDMVLFAPVGAQPLKLSGPTASFEHRLAMTRLAIAGEAGFAVSTADAPKPSGAPNYTVETLERLRRELPAGSELLCLMGADSFANLRAWRRASELPFVAPLIVASRPGEPLDRLAALLPDGVSIDAEPQRTGSRAVELRCSTLRNAAGATAPLYLLPGLHVEISASEIRSQLRIRAQLRAALDARAQTQEPLSAAVAGYIRAHNLYQWDE
jgi:nicotinate-nucleotide adenylyltransferase